MRKTEKEYRKFEADVLAMPPLAMVLADIPKPDPDLKIFREKKIAARKHFFQNNDLLERLIEHMAKPE